MGERSEIVSADDPFNEAVATTGLFLMISAIIALAFALGSWSLSETLFAVLSGAVALLSFAASMFCFTSQAREQAPVEVSA
ncbi:hypothetical protein EUA04_25840 [Mycolicibacterium obuense]|uniref:Uncharacterized protein n=1 Tax=Mycolicibacterium obuense TaxID=1807 RepID=A0A0J6VZI8_9MYCO|nr:hypothetical protein [Mycolicibacterium obuense]KKF00396.1 hypothetical protein WN67_19075 [Mycolicibacterium obuense]KMO75524.1 hypothetical protein MOBUDSM44075_03120 [Mycolicibacterium obuense]TDL03348.1 hypothetical protein EUA04_25840 [Mycolicibacterium obuense]